MTRAAIAACGAALAWLALAAGGAAAQVDIPAGETFRLVSAFKGDPVATESADLSPARLLLREDTSGGHRLWDVTAELATPTVARRIEALQYEPALNHSSVVLHVVAKVVGARVTITTTDVAHPGASATKDVALPADGVVLPRGLTGTEMLLRDMRARGLAQRSFTWIDPMFRTESGTATFPDPTHAHVHIANATAGQPDEDDDFVIDSAGRIQTGETAMGLSAHREPWAPAPGERIGVPHEVVPKKKPPKGGGR